METLHEAVDRYGGLPTGASSLIKALLNGSELAVARNKLSFQPVNRGHSLDNAELRNALGIDERRTAIPSWLWGMGLSSNKTPYTSAARWPTSGLSFHGNLNHEAMINWANSSVRFVVGIPRSEQLRFTRTLIGLGDPSYVFINASHVSLFSSNLTDKEIKGRGRPNIKKPILSFWSVRYSLTSGVPPKEIPNQVLLDEIQDTLGRSVDMRTMQNAKREAKKAIKA